MHKVREEYIVAVQVGAVKIYVAAVEALRKPSSKLVVVSQIPSCTLKCFSAGFIGGAQETIKTGSCFSNPQLHAKVLFSRLCWNFLLSMTRLRVLVVLYGISGCP
jgi:hypothetical protein